MKLLRIQEMEAYILKNGSASLDELCKEFNVSKNTIRRDINKLVENGVIRKVYGGVTAVEKSLVSFENRKVRNQAEKTRIAREAANFIKDDDLIFIDSGTTTKSILSALDPNISITVLTNSLDVINAATGFERIHLIVIGNSYKHKTRSFVGIDEAAILQKYNIHKAFMSATGVSIAHGLTNADQLEYEIKKIAAEKAREVFLLADQSKFGKSTLLTYAPFNRIDHLITSAPLDKEYEAYCQDHHIEVVVAAEHHVAN